VVSKTLHVITFTFLTFFQNPKTWLFTFFFCFIAYVFSNNYCSISCILGLNCPFKIEYCLVLTICVCETMWMWRWTKCVRRENERTTPMCLCVQSSTLMAAAIQGGYVNALPTLTTAAGGQLTSLSPPNGVTLSTVAPSSGQLITPACIAYRQSARGTTSTSHRHLHSTTLTTTLLPLLSAFACLLDRSVFPEIAPGYAEWIPIESRQRLEIAGANFFHVTQSQTQSIEWTPG